MSIQYVMLHTVENSVFSISELSNVCRFKCYLGGGGPSSMWLPLLKVVDINNALDYRML